MRWPKPPPRVTPAIPVELIEPPVVASPCRWVARSSSDQVSPAAARAVRVRQGEYATAADEPPAWAVTGSFPEAAALALVTLRAPR